MPFWIASAVLAGSAYQADRARKTAKEARIVAEREAAVTQSQTQQQIEIQQQQAGIAKERLSAETAKYAEQKGAMEAEANRIAKELEDERRRMGQEESSKMRARIRGGQRALLSEQRLTPEIGMLGAGMEI
jgi:secreted protein with Ig-like and vWFA domain